MDNQNLAAKHGHSSQYWAPEPGLDKKEKLRLKILLIAIFVAAVIFILCILLAIGRANVRGYIPTLILELDLTPIGQKPILLGKIDLPQFSDKIPEALAFPEQTLKQNIEFDQPFTPVINRRVEYQPIYEQGSCFLCQFFE